MSEFTTQQRLDYLTPCSKANPAFSFQVLLPGDRGHMFGVMECTTPEGETVFLRAFSSLGTGVRDIPGWVPYILDTATFNHTILPKQNEIKRLTRLRNSLPPDAPARAAIEEERAGISRSLMPAVHDLYQLKNFRGETRSLRDVFRSAGGIPGGVGDCCAPKLLNYAASRDLRPVSVAEFYWGGTNKSGSKVPGQFYEACEEKCQPILGFMLCGLK